jgi:hypothetical protein
MEYGSNPDPKPCLRVGTLHSEMSVHEKGIDFFIGNTFYPLHRFSHALNTCSIEAFLRVGTLDLEVSVPEGNIFYPLHQFSHALNTCFVESFLCVGTLHLEMSVHEKGVDFYIGNIFYQLHQIAVSDLLHKRQLDENVYVTNLKQTVSYFKTIAIQINKISTLSDLLHKGQLDENVHVTNLERTVSYFETIYPLHLHDIRYYCSLSL